jgi:hypothetical protein
VSLAAESCVKGPQVATNWVFPQGAGRALFQQPTSKTLTPASARTGELKVFEEIRQLRPVDLVVTFETHVLGSILRPNRRRPRSGCGPASAAYRVAGRADSVCDGASGSLDEVSLYGGLPLGSPPGGTNPLALRRDLREATVEIHRGLAGKTTLHSAALSRNGSGLSAVGTEPEISATPGARIVLTERQTEVLSWVVRGKTNAEIGKILSLRAGTIGKYLERISPNSALRTARWPRVSSSERRARAKWRQTGEVPALLTGRPSPCN